MNNNKGRAEHLDKKYREAMDATSLVYDKIADKIRECNDPVLGKELALLLQELLDKSSTESEVRLEQRTSLHMGLAKDLLGMN